MQWVFIAGALVIGYFLFKWLVKPLFKLTLILALAALVWLLLTSWR